MRARCWVLELYIHPPHSPNQSHSLILVQLLLEEWRLTLPDDESPMPGLEGSMSVGVWQSGEQLSSPRKQVRNQFKQKIQL